MAILCYTKPIRRGGKLHFESAVHCTKHIARRRFSDVYIFPGELVMNENTFLYNTILNGMSEKHFLKKMKMTDSESPQLTVVQRSFCPYRRITRLH